MVVIATITQSINLEVARPNIFQALVAKQYDSNSRFLKVTFVNNGKVIEVSPTAIVTINADRNDGQSKSFAGLVNSDGTATVPLTAWMLGISGTLYCDVSIIDEENSKLTSTKFTVLVEEASCSDEDISQDEDYDILTQLIQEVSELKQDLPEDGFSPTIKVTPITGGNRMVITDVNGSQTVDIKNGKDGKDCTEVTTTDFVPLQDVLYGDKTDLLSKSLVAIMPTENDIGSYNCITISVSGYESTERWTITFTQDGLDFSEEMQYFPPFSVGCQAGDVVVLNKYLDLHETDTVILSNVESNVYAKGLFDGVVNASTIAKMVSGGVNGVDGESAYQYARDGGYTGTEETFAMKLAQEIPTITQEAGQSESLVMSQKAVTDLVNTALDEIKSDEYETVDSVDKMTDKTKSYVLSTTGTVWTYTETTVEVKPQNKFVPSTATLNQRLSGSAGTVSANDSSVGSFVTDYIAVKDLDKTASYIAHLNWELVTSDENKVVFFNASKARIGNNVFGTTVINYTVSNGGTAIDLMSKFTMSTVMPSNWSDVAYVRFQLFANPHGTTISASDISSLTITFDADGGTKTENTWVDTGVLPENSATSYVDLLVKTNDNASNIKEISNRVTALETGSETLTIPTFWQTAVNEVISKIKTLQVGRNCITFPFFSDNHTRNGYAGTLIAYIMKECNIPYCFCGGDSISSGYIADEATMIAQDKAFDTIMSYIPNGRFCRAVGNHDGYWAVSSTEKYHYTDSQIYDLFLREESICQTKHFGGDGTYYYVDEIASKVRFVVLDTNDGAVEDEQLTWLQNVALSFNESGWGVVFISHQPISNHYHAGISNATSVIDIIKNHINGTSTNKADIIGWYSGHIHRDRIYTGIATNTSDDTQGTALGFTQVTISSDNTSIAYDDATKHTVANDDKSHAIDFVTINRKTRTVNLTRLGIGEDRSYTY